jgi:hypothetical protein
MAIHGPSLDTTAMGGGRHPPCTQGVPFLYILEVLVRCTVGEYHHGLVDKRAALVTQPWPVPVQRQMFFVKELIVSSRIYFFKKVS